MDLVFPHCCGHHSDINEASLFSQCCLNTQANRKGWNYVTCLWTPKEFTSNKVRESLMLSPLCTKAYNRLVNRKYTTAWTKTSENFYNDDDDTLLELPHEDLFPSVERGGFAKLSKLSSAEAKKKGSSFPRQTLRWLLWILGPCVLLTTGVIPTLWLPFVPLFDGSATAGLLALAGLDGIFNLGASIFLLMADSCARNWRGSMQSPDHQLPLVYKVWSFFANTVGFLAPLVAFIASKRGFLEPQPPLLPLSAMLAPYSALLLVHMFAEVLVWQWRSPVWAVLPLIYDCYSLLQLSRGIQLGLALGAPLWLIEGVKGLISWWVFVLGVQLIWIAWFCGRLQD